MNTHDQHTTSNRKRIVENANKKLKISNNFLQRLKYKPFSQGGLSFEFFETSKFILLCTQKGGSTFINNILEENNLFVHNPNDVRQEFQDNNNFIDLFDKNYKVKTDGVREFIKILSGTSKKDLIIVTRNPIIKWMSGVIQDLDFIVLDNLFLKKIVHYKKSDNSEEDTLNLQKSIMIDFLLDRLERHGTTAIEHSTLYNELFYQLLIINDNIDLNKLVIVDIDNPDHNLAVILKRYYPEIKESKNFNYFWTHREKHQYIFGDLQEKIEERGLEILLNSITKHITDDYRWYLILLDKYKNNLWKE